MGQILSETNTQKVVEVHFDRTAIQIDPPTGGRYATFTVTNNGPGICLVADLPTNVEVHPYQIMQFTRPNLKLQAVLGGPADNGNATVTVEQSPSQEDA